MPSGYSIQPQRLVQMSNAYGTLPNLPPFLGFTQGKYYFVKPSSGNDVNNDGLSPDSAFKSLLRAYNAAQANRNDVIFLMGEGNSADACTSRQITTLTWAKDCLHLIGINSGASVSPRSRIGFVSDYATASNLMTVSANGCHFANLQLFEGVASALPTGCLKVSGSRNRFDNCHIAGIGNDANDIAGAYSILLDAAAENDFNNCVIGLTTIGAGSAANSDLRVDTASARNNFTDCKFVRRVDHATDYVFVRVVDATAIEDWLNFTRCQFIATATNYTPTLAAIMSIAALTQGFIQVYACAAYTSNNGAAALWDANSADKIQIAGSPLPAGDTALWSRAV